MVDPYQVVRDFEQALCDYTGAKYAVTTTSCTMALLLACRWHYLDPNNSYENSKITPWRNETITLPARTYIGVPMSIIHAGFNVEFRNEEWGGAYQLNPLPIWDYARIFTSGMYTPFHFQCLSFHWSKHLAIGQGGAILHDSPEADKWFRKARFDGRTEGVDPKDDNIDTLGYHCYMSPRDAAEGLSRLAVLPKHNAPLPNSDYPDLSKMAIFQ